MESWVEMVAVLGVLGSIVNLGTYALVAKMVLRRREIDAARPYR